MSDSDRCASSANQVSESGPLESYNRAVVAGFCGFQSKTKTAQAVCIGEAVPITANGLKRWLHESFTKHPVYIDFIWINRKTSFECSAKIVEIEAKIQQLKEMSELNAEH